MRKFAGALLLSLFAAAPTWADDGSAQLGAGGIVFVKSADIRMAQEDLYISPEKVRIRFAFQNKQDIHMAVLR